MMGTRTDRLAKAVPRIRLNDDTQTTAGTRLVTLDLLHPDGVNHARLAVHWQRGWEAAGNTVNLYPMPNGEFPANDFDRRYANHFGPAGIRHVARHLRETYGVTKVRGERVTGARNPGHGPHGGMSYEVGRTLSKARVDDDFGLPPRPGTAPIPDGHVRLYHQTTLANLDSIRKEGLHIRHAKGIEGPKSIYADESGFYGSPETTPTIEFHVPKEQFSRPFVRTDHVPVSNIIGIHVPWHRTARYLSEPEHRERTLRGEHDHMLSMGDHHRQAIEHVKARYAQKPNAQLPTPMNEPMSKAAALFNQRLAKSEKQFWEKEDDDPRETKISPKVKEAAIRKFGKWSAVAAAWAVRKEKAHRRNAMKKAADGNRIGFHGDEPDHEGSMARSQLRRAHHYAAKLYNMLNDRSELPGWVQYKIAVASDALGAAFHYLDYEQHGDAKLDEGEG